jgi:hypothetical protein
MMMPVVCRFVVCWALVEIFLCTSSRALFSFLSIDGLSESASEL